MSRMLYSFPSTIDNVANAAFPLITVDQGSLDSGYDINWLADDNPARVVSCTASSNVVRIVFDFGATVDFKIASLIHIGEVAGVFSTIRIFAHTSNSWGSPAQVASFVIPTKDGEGFRANPWLDLVAAGFSSTVYRYWAIQFALTSGSKIRIGQVFFTQKREVETDPSVPLEFVDERPGRQSGITAAGVEWRYPSITRQTVIGGEVDSEYWATYRNWNLYCSGPDRPCLIIPDQTVNEAFLVRWTEDFRRTAAVLPSRQQFRVGWRELSRGGAIA